jgi:hypothetical protein
MITLIRGVAIVTTAGLISLSAITMMRARVDGKPSWLRSSAACRL